jgi:hypothetical protein
MPKKHKYCNNYKMPPLNIIAEIISFNPHERVYQVIKKNKNRPDCNPNGFWCGWLDFL